MANVKITDLTAATILDGTELFECVQSGNSRKADADQIRAFVIKQNVTPQAVTNGFTASFTALQDVMILTGSGTTTGGTINLPSSPLNGQTVHVTTDHTLNTLTFAASGGATIYGAPSSMTVTTPNAYIYESTANAWYRTV